MHLEEIRGLIESGEKFNYFDILKNWDRTKINERGSVIEKLYWHAKDNSSLPKFLEDIIMSSYLNNDKPIRREKNILVKLVNSNWIDYTKRVEYLEDADIEEFRQEYKFNTANMETYFEIDKYKLLKNAFGLADSSSIRDENERVIIESVYSAFNLGYNVGLKFLDKKGFSFYTESEYDDVYNLVHLDKGYKPAIQKARKIFDECNSRMEKLVQMGFVSKLQAHSYKEQDFEILMADEGFSYLMCMPFAEHIKESQMSNKVEATKEMFNTLYQTAIFAFHLVIKEKVEKQKRLHSSIFPDLDLSTYRQFHEF